MLGRQKTSKKGTDLPADWKESLSQLLNETFQNECKANNRYFDVYGQIYPKELLLVVSYLSKVEETIAPITLFLSCDPNLLNNEQKMNDVQKNYIELVGLFFDEVFARSDWNEFEPNWQEVTHNKQKFFYKLSRENIKMTLEANRLLGDDFEDVEFESDESDNQ